MALGPTSTTGRVIAVTWLLLCIGVLVFAWVQKDINDMPIAFLWLMVFLTAPIGIVITALDGVAGAMGITNQPFWEMALLWVVFVVAGYVQWFVFLPSVWGHFRAQRAI